MRNPGPVILIGSPQRHVAVETAYAFQRNAPIHVGSGRSSAADRTTKCICDDSRLYPISPPVPLISTRPAPPKPIHAILPYTEPDPTNPMDNSPSFSRCLARATRTPLRPPDTPQLSPSLLVSSNGNPTSHAELGPQKTVKSLRNRQKLIKQIAEAERQTEGCRHEHAKLKIYRHASEE